MKTTLHLFAAIALTVISLANVRAQDQVSNTKRYVKFVYAGDDRIEALWQRNNEMLGYLLDGVRAGDLDVYEMDYGTFTEKKLTLEEFRDKTVFNVPAPDDADLFADDWDVQPMDAEEEITYYYNREFDYFGLDITEQDQGADVVYHCNYINFYTPFMDCLSGSPEYLFSIQWEKALDYLKKAEINYYTIPNPPVYGVNTLVFSDRYSVDGAQQKLFKTAYELGVLIKDESQQAFDSLKFIDKKHAIEFPDWEFEVREDKKNRITSVHLQDKDLWSKPDESKPKKTLSFEWKSFTKACKKAKLNSGSVYSLSDALSTGIIPFSKDKFFSPQVLAAPKTTIQITPNFNTGVTRPLVQNEIEVLEEIDLDDISNKHFKGDTALLSKLMIEYVLSGQLSVNTKNGTGGTEPLTIGEFQAAISLLMDYSTWEEEADYESGQVVLKDGEFFSVKYGRADNDFWLEESLGDPHFEDQQLIPYQMERYPLSDFHLIGVYSRVTFDGIGKKKDYDVESLELSIPANSSDNFRGIQMFVGQVPWKELATLLRKDSRAVVMYEGTEQNLADLIEGRKHKTSFLWTGHPRGFE